MTLLALAGATLISEDLACVTAGVLVARGDIDPVAGVLACMAGIFGGDVALWTVGRVAGRAAWSWTWVASRLRGPRLEVLAERLARGAPWAIVASRFLPGTRLPLYVASGALNVPLRVFATWTLLAVAVWVPALVLLVAAAGTEAASAFTRTEQPAWPAHAVVLVGFVSFLRGARAGAAARWRQRVAARIVRWRRWEFWPMWAFYAPVVAWVGLLSLRYGGPTTITAANPGMPDGGTVGESKSDILALLPAAVTIRWFVVEPGPRRARLAGWRERMEERGWTFPLVLKPDVGQRGQGVRLARSAFDVARYLAREPRRVLVQPYHPGPFEAGVFYYRHPAAARGRILSITDKHFPAVIGDGRSTVEDLIWAHPRYRVQAATFLVRHRRMRDRILAPGERLQLALAGNHAQGTLFRDGRHLITPALEQRIDEIARACPGFYVGRFDVRYSDPAEFIAGRDLAIVELNGATAEATDIYDPANSLLAAYRRLFTQWRMVYAIGAANRSRGARVSSLRRMVRLIREHCATRPGYVISD